MTDSPTPPHEMDELDMPERPSGVKRKRPAAEASPNFNTLPRPQRRVSADERDALGRVVRQPPPAPGWMVKPLAPPMVKR